MPFTRRTATLVLFLLALTLAACGAAPQAAPQPIATMAPLALTGNLADINLCQAIPQAAIEAVLGRKLAAAPQRFEYYDAPGSSGCQYDAGKDSRGNALFAYVALTPPAAYGQQPLVKNQPVSGIGDAAYFNNGADARQLWVKVGDEAALVVAIGDLPNEAGLKTIAGLVAGALK